MQQGTAAGPFFFAEKSACGQSSHFQKQKEDEQTWDERRHQQRPPSKNIMAVTAVELRNELEQVQQQCEQSIQEAAELETDIEEAEERQRLRRPGHRPEPSAPQSV